MNYELHLKEIRLAGDGMCLGRHLQDDEHHDAGKEPEVADADFAVAQNLVIPEHAKLGEVAPQQVPCERACALCRITGDEQAEDEYNDSSDGAAGAGKGGSLPAGIRPPELEQGVDEVKCTNLANQQCQHGGDFHHSAGKADVFRTHDILHQPLLGRAEEHGLNAENSKAADSQRQTLKPEPHRHTYQHQHLKQHHGLQQAGLAPAVSNPSAQR